MTPVMGIFDSIYTKLRYIAAINGRFHHIPKRKNSSLANLDCSSKNPEITRKLYNDVVPKIGLEVHAQLKIGSKLFSQGSAGKNETPNTSLDLLDISLPGSLPKLNQVALEKAILSSLGLNCSVQSDIHFDRKNYFYSDMPAGYQITQYHRPLARNGYIDFIVTTYHNSVIGHSENYDIQKYLFEDERGILEDFEPYIKRSEIKQIQLEQDSAKTLHYDPTDNTESYSLVDYNRCGLALMEIVFEPDLSNHHEASSLVRELICLLKALGTCDCEMQEGSLRIDANVSIEKISGENILNTGRVELKNLNSIRSVNRALHHEINRQANLLRGGKVVAQESRTYDTKSHKTIALRAKETAIDYRYVPEPNIPPIEIDPSWVEHINRQIPCSVPSQARERLLAKNLDLRVITEIIDEPGLSDYMFEIIDTRPKYDVSVVADFLIYSIANLRNMTGPSTSVDLSPEGNFLKRLNIKLMQSIFDMLFEDEISFHIAYELMKHYFVNTSELEPREVVTKLGWLQVKEKDEVMKICDDSIARMKSMSKKYKKTGNKKLMKLMLDKISETTNNRVSIKVAMDCINKRLRPGEQQ